MNADQLVDFVTERLQTQHKMQILTQSLEPTMPAKQVHQVQQQPPSQPSQPGKGTKGKGRKGSGKDNSHPQSQTNGASTSTTGQGYSSPYNSPGRKGSNQSPTSGKGRQSSPGKGKAQGTATSQSSSCPLCLKVGKTASHSLEQCPEWQKYQKYEREEHCGHCKNRDFDPWHDWKTCPRRPKKHASYSYSQPKQQTPLRRDATAPNSPPRRDSSPRRQETSPREQQRATSSSTSSNTRGPSNNHNSSGRQSGPR